MDQPRIVDTGTRLEISTNFPRPLDQIVGALSMRYGWHLNYEDPRYSASELVDNTAPAWLQQHPNGRRVYAVAGSSFAVDIPLSASAPGTAPDPEWVLAAIVSAYNKSDNPGRFELRKLDSGTFDIVPKTTDDVTKKPILDAIMDFNATRTASADATLHAFCNELSQRTGDPIQFWGFGGIASNLLLHSTIEVHAHGQPTREILRQMLAQLSRMIAWRVLYDADLNAFIVELRQ